jgi:2-polyprenyl-3-methyl-5-hydroxy-6-metoxy-1,4-benzoquinol methylase
MSYNKIMAQYYDLLYSTKDYKKEIEFIKNTTDGFTSKKILDIGCGTGTHTILISALQPLSVTGIDLSVEMIQQAQSRNFDSQLIKFLVSDITELEDKNFDLIISMFNVVNHINDLDYLYKFFKNIREKIKKEGYLVFDSWNGAAAFKDPPRPQEKMVEGQGTKIKIRNTPRMNWMESRVTMNVEAEIEIDSAPFPIESFSYELHHTIWTPKILKDLLKMSNFKLVNLYRAFNSDTEATQEDYKIVFICKAI